MITPGTAAALSSVKGTTEEPPKRKFQECRTTAVAVGSSKISYLGTVGNELIPQEMSLNVTENHGVGGSIPPLGTSNF
jgi:hypothetical protein